MIKEAIIKLAGKKNLTYSEAYDAMDEIMSGKASSVQVSSYLTALEMKGETTQELTASASAMRAHCVKLLHDADVLEIVGTGDDRTKTFNISTAASLVAAAGGVPVAKHGSRAADGKCGSADVLEALGVNIMLPAAKSAKLLDSIGICFLFSQNYHIAMKYVAPVRRELGIRTIFDLLGPLSNPAGAKMELLGTGDASLVEPLARALSNLGVKSAMVVHGDDGQDEISMCSSTQVCEIKNGRFRSYIISPEQFGLKRCRKYELAGGTPEHNAEIVRGVLSGKDKDGRRGAVLLNAGAAFAVAGKTRSVADGVKLAASLIDGGAAAAKLEEFIARSNGR